MSRLLQAIRSSDSETEIPDNDPIAKDIQQALKKTRWKLSKLERLSGGNANFTYRGWLKKPDKDSYDTIIIKHAEPYVALSKEWKIDVGRAVS
jgi:5-methylthioribose kinase